MTRSCSIRTLLRGGVAVAAGLTPLTVLALRPVDALVTHTHAARARAVIVTAAVHVTRLARPAKVTGARVVGLAHTPAVQTVVVAPA